MRLYHPDADPAAATAAAENQAAITKLTTDLAIATASITTLTSDVKGMKEVEEATKVMLTGDPESTAYAEATRKVLMHHGYSADDVKDYLSGEPVEGLIGDDGEPVEGADDDEEAVPMKPSDVEKIVTETLGKQSVEQEKARMDNLTNLLTTTVKSHLDTDEGLGLFYKDLGDLRGEDVVKAAKARHPGSLDLLTRQILQERVNVEGKANFHESWIAEAAKKATETLITQERSVMGDPGTAGRSPETVSGLEDVDLKKTVEYPKVDPDKGVNPSTLEDDLQKAISGDLTQGLKLVEQEDTKA